MGVASPVDPRILAELTGYPRGMTAQQLSGALGVDLLTIYNRLRALMSRGSVEKAGKGPSLQSRKAVTYFRLKRPAAAQ